MPKLLVVEDNEVNRLVVSYYLDKGGYAHDAVASGVEAVAMAKVGSYAIVLMDISMPDMDGFETVRRIRALGGWAENVPIFAMTAHVMSGDRERCFAAGMNDYISKPLDCDELVRKLDWWLAQGTPVTVLPDADGKVLRRLVRDLGAGAVLRITDAFLSDLARQVDILKQRGRESDWAAVALAAHTLKSSSGNCGLKRFSALMAELEAASSKSEALQVAALLPQIDSVCEAAKGALAGELGDIESSA